MAKKNRALDFPAMVAPGENSKGFRSQTPDCNENGEGGAPYQQYRDWGGNVNGDRFNQFGDDPEPWALDGKTTSVKPRRK